MSGRVTEMATVARKLVDAAVKRAEDAEARSARACLQLDEVVKENERLQKQMKELA